MKSKRAPSCGCSHLNPAYGFIQGAEAPPRLSTSSTYTTKTKATAMADKAAETPSETTIETAPDPDEDDLDDLDG